MGIFKKSNKEEKTKKAPVFYKKEQNSSSDIEDINENNEIALEDYYPEETTDYGSESDNPYNEMHEQMHEQDSISIWQDRTGQHIIMRMIPLMK